MKNRYRFAKWRHVDGSLQLRFCGCTNQNLILNWKTCSEITHSAHDIYTYMHIFFPRTVVNYALIGSIVWHLLRYWSFLLVYVCLFVFVRVCVCPRRIHCATSVRVYEIIIITAVAVACWYAILTSSNAVWPLLRLPCFSPPTNSCGHIRKSNLVWSMTIQTHFLRNALTRCVCV